jgi:putative DNA primase/helicase
MLNTISDIFGDYHRKAPSELLMDSKHDRHPQELARLVGARLVTTSEIPRGRRWNLARVKDLTGGDPITAHFMRKNDFTFMPQFGLVVAGNEKPKIPSVDEAIRRRLRLIPCTVTIPEPECDRDLPDRLKAEAPGILRKLIAGAVEWYRDGLQTPASVLNASAEYLASEDKIGNWIAACCVREPHCKSTSFELYTSWKAWAERGGEWVMTQTDFTKELTKEFSTKRSNGGTLVFGLRLKWSGDAEHDGEAEQDDDDDNEFS